VPAGAAQRLLLELLFRNKSATADGLMRGRNARGNTTGSSHAVAGRAGAPGRAVYLLMGVGKMYKRHELTVQEYLALEADHQGVCLRYGVWSGGTDPGAAAARCGTCGTLAVHGVEQALLMGAVQIRR
jgi:hypothetical protein